VRGDVVQIELCIDCGIPMESRCVLLFVTFGCNLKFLPAPLKISPLLCQQIEEAWYYTYGNDTFEVVIQLLQGLFFFVCLSCCLCMRVRVCVCGCGYHQLC